MILTTDVWSANPPGGGGGEGGFGSVKIWFQYDSNLDGFGDTPIVDWTVWIRYSYDADFGNGTEHIVRYYDTTTGSGMINVLAENLPGADDALDGILFEYVEVYSSPTYSLSEGWVYDPISGYCRKWYQTESVYETALFFDPSTDQNQNGVVDDFELPLAQKFCPVIFCPVKDSGLEFGGGNIPLRPVPVEIMDIDGPNGVPDGKLDYHDVFVEIQMLGGDGMWFTIAEYQMEELILAGQLYSSYYPHQVERDYFDEPSNTMWHPHYEWNSTNIPEENEAWYAKWEQIYNDNPSNSFIRDGVTYVSFIKNMNEVTIQYRMHYPFNNASARHEGDWPNLQVTVNSQDPNVAEIVSVAYPFHAVGTIRHDPIAYTEDYAETFYNKTYYDQGYDQLFGDNYFVIDNTHPVSFAGGRINELGLEGYGSHAQYPLIGTWIREVTILQVDIEEYVVENGSIPGETIRIDFNNYQNIILIPPKAYVVEHLINDTDFN